MFVYILFFITIACVLLVEGTSRETIQERRNTKTIGEMKGVSTQLQTYLQRQTDYKVSDRRILNCTCGTYHPNEGADAKGCCFCITDGCGSSASICCERHTYCNCVTGECGCCIDLAYNVNPTKGTTARYADTIKTFANLQS